MEQLTLDERKLKKRFETIKDRVVLLCRRNPDIYKNYNVLLAKYYWTYHKRLFGVKHFEDLYDLPSSESITRAFRKGVEDYTIHVPDSFRFRRLARSSEFKKVINRGDVQ